jgi:hypothetical protein
MAIEYTCEGCGVRVAALSVSEPPAHGFCVQCAFLCEYIPDPGEMLAVRKALDADRHVTTTYRYKRPAGKRAKAASGAVRRPPFTRR